MNVGLLPALGGSIAALRASGQDSRLVDGYLAPYARAFDQVTYFSYVPETLGDYTSDAGVLEAVVLRAPHRRVARLRRAVTLPVAERRLLRVASVLRVFQVTGVIPALIARRVWGVPFVTTYGFWYAKLSRPGLPRLAKLALERVGLRAAAAVIVTTTELGDHVARILGSAKRVHLVPNGVDTTRFAPGPSRPPAIPRRILYVGRLEPEKNPGVIVEAASRLTARDVRLCLVGAGSLEPTLRAQAAALGVDVEFAGVVDHRHLPERLRDADAFVLPSFTEGHPKALIEAMAVAVPCVVSDCAGNRSLVANGETGALFDPTRPDALAACLDRVLADPAAAGAMGRRARDRAVKELDLATLVDREIALLRSVARS